jgi:hypothetical protein
MSIGQPDFSSVTMPGLQSPIYQSGIVAGSGGLIPYTFAVPAVTFRTLFLQVAVLHGSALTNIEVAGSGSGLVYYNQTPYLPNEVTLYDTYPVVVPVLGGIDQTYIVTVTTPSATGFLNVYADTASYDESIFYNGYPKYYATVLNAAGTTTLVAGPCRLLTAALGAQAASNGNIFANGTVILNVQGSGAVAMPLPQPYIIQRGQVVALNWGAGTILGAVTAAYP